MKTGFESGAEVLLHDPRREPPQWTDLLSPGSCAVLVTDAKSGLPLSAAGKHGEHPTCTLFQSLPEAEQYCLALAGGLPGLCCEIYDSAGKGNAPLRVFTSEAQTEPRWRKRLGWSFVLAGVAMLIYDSTQKWDTIWATAIGLKLILFSLILLLWDPLKRMERRRALPRNN